MAQSKSFCLLLVLAAIFACCSVWLAWLPSPYSGLPLDTIEHKLMLWEESTRGERKDDLCFLCQEAIYVLRDYLEKNASVEKIFPVVEPMCLFFMEKAHGYYGPYMCPGIIHSYGPVVLDVIAQGALDPSDICTLLHLCNGSTANQPAPHLPSLLRESWDKLSRTAKKSSYQSVSRADSPATSEEKAREKSTGDSPASSGEKAREKRTGDSIVFVQISDIHLDQQFSEGSPSHCNLYLCCRRWYNGTGPAGHYGDFNCDLPLVTLDLVVETIAQLDPQPDFIIYTGDNGPHDIWNETWATQYEATDYLVSYLAEKLPNRSRHIYPAIGNHESFPASEYMGSLRQYQALNRKLADYWQTLVPLPQSALDTITDDAYYTVLIQDKLRVVSFNSDYGYSINFYAQLNNKDYSKQQVWIIDTLEKAEQAGEKVIMMAHIPPGYPGNTLPTYEEFYLNLTKRYRDTIVAHLFGHTHHDEFKLVQDEDGVYGTVMICPSVTPYSRSNPSFRVFTMNSSTYQLQGYQQYHLNLTLANELAAKGVKPAMELAYTTSDLYHLPDLSPTSWASLVERFSDYPELVSDYRYNIYGRSSSHDRSCDSQCVRGTICAVSNILSLQRSICSIQ